MSGLFGVLDVANRGLTITQQGIRVAGHNIANVNTPGYSRQRQVLAAQAALPRASGHLGTGVEQLTIDRVTDTFIEAQLLKQHGSLSSSEAQARVLSLVEEVLNEQNGEGVSAALSRLYDAFSDLASAAPPGAPAEREAVRAAARSLVEVVHGMDAQLRDLQASMNHEIQSAIPEINSISQRIADLNGRIIELELQAPANDLRDQRDELLRDLASRVEVTSFEKPDGSIVVMMGGGASLVDGVHVRRLDTAPDPTHPFDPTFSRILWVDDGFSYHVTDEVGAGSLGGQLRARDDLIPSAIRSLDVLAYNLARGVNAVHTAGVGLDGTVGGFFASPAAVEDAARDLALHGNIVARADAIAAGLTPAPGDNRNALALAALRDAPATLVLPGDPPGPPSGPNRTILEHAGAVVADVGQQARTLGQASNHQARILEDLQNRRDETSGVSLDEEMAGLVQLEAAYQANARVLSTVSRLLDDLLSML